MTKEEEEDCMIFFCEINDNAFDAFGVSLLRIWVKLRRRFRRSFEDLRESPKEKNNLGKETMDETFPLRRSSAFQQSSSTNVLSSSSSDDNSGTLTRQRSSSVSDVRVNGTFHHFIYYVFYNHIKAVMLTFVIIHKQH